MGRSSMIACLILAVVAGCSDSEPKFVVGESAEIYKKEILLALFEASELKIDVAACESHNFTYIGEFLVEIYMAEGISRKISLQCPKEEGENLFCEFNLDHGKDNTLVRFVYDKKNNQLLNTFTPQCIRVP